jgi:hypothetical protein
MALLQHRLLRCSLPIIALALITVIPQRNTFGQSSPVPTPTIQTYLSLVAGGQGSSGNNGGNDAGSGDGREPIVFVSRQIGPDGSIYWDKAKDMPGVGPHNRFKSAAPGKLLVREPDGSIRTLIDGSRPTADSLFLVDVNAPAVSYDAQRIVFAGLPQGQHRSQGSEGYLGAWRLFVLNSDGSGLRQLTLSDQQLDMGQFAAAGGGLTSFDDSDPAWLPDGRIVFSSTRWPSYGHYSGVRATNLYVVDADGTNLRRITAERNGADRPLVDPLTGKIVYSRWWRNHRFPTDSLAMVADPNGGYVQKDGLTADRNNPVGGETMFRNAWQATLINPDGTELELFTGQLRDEAANHIYGGGFAPDGSLYANFFPMYNMTEAAGFGGIRKYRRGAAAYQPIIGVTRLTQDYVHPSNPTSFGILKGNYASEAEVLSDNRLVVSWARDYNQDYGLYTLNADGSGLTKLYDNPGTAELRARALRPRPLPPIIPDRVSRVASLLPPGAAGPYAADGTFVYDALNVYANAPVDTAIVSAPPVGSAKSIRFFIDHQRTSPGSFPNLDWPILIGELSVNPDGSVNDPNAPANVPLFEQLRDPAGRVPLTGLPDANGAAHVAGMNFGRPGAVARCVGCHAGHTLMPVPATQAEAQWSNLAPGAALRVSSVRDAKYTGGLIDRRVLKGELWHYWHSAPGQVNGQWVELVFPVPISVRNVRLYNPRQQADCDLVVQGATIRLYSDAAGTVEVAQQRVGRLSVAGVDTEFDAVKARVVRVELGAVSGRIQGLNVASLAEIEVIARGEAP